MENNKNIKRILISFLVIMLIAISFFRESVFVNINAHMSYLFYYNNKTYLARYLYFLSPLSYKQLYWFKWGLTIFFSLIFLINSILIIRLIFKEKKFIHWTIYSYLSIAMVATVSYLSGLLFNKVDIGYTISRFFMGMIQSPFLLIFLIPAFKLATSTSEMQKE